METFMSQLQQSQSLLAEKSSQINEILNSSGRKFQETIVTNQRKNDSFVTAYESQVKQQTKENISQMHQWKETQCEFEQHKVQREAEEKLIATLQQELSILQKEERALSSKVPVSGVSDDYVKRLNTEEAYFKKHLAVEMVKVTGGWLQVIFTQIHPEKPNSKFFFMLRLDENKLYEVGDCQPPIKDMKLLLSRLNSSNNLSEFVHSVRKRFRMLFSHK